ncbi:MAG: hypothetical protein Q4C58_00780 [Eubacteriales bacterium]|nr:hypothetical protein [Eubacteriales bacterium]
MFKIVRNLLLKNRKAGYNNFNEERSIRQEINRIGQIFSKQPEVHESAMLLSLPRAVSGKGEGGGYTVKSQAKHNGT